MLYRKPTTIEGARWEEMVYFCHAFWETIFHVFYNVSHNVPHIFTSGNQKHRLPLFWNTFSRMFLQQIGLEERESLEDRDGIL